MKKGLFATITLLFFLNYHTAFAQPVGWSGVQVFTATNPGNTLVTNYQMRITVNTAALVTANQMQASGADMRFGKNCAGTVLYPHWIDSGMNSTNTVVWVRIDSIPAMGTRTFYMYYGNATAATTSTLSIFNGPFSSTNQVLPPSTNTVSNCQRGFRFSPNETILVTQFGKRTPDATTRYVTLFDFTTQAIVRQMQVSGTAATYSYQNLPQHVWLNQNQQYLLQLYNGTNDMYYFGTTSQIATQLTYYDMRYCNSCTQNTFPTSILTNYHYGVPDFNFYTKANVTPAPTYTVGGSSSNSIVTHPASQTVCNNGSTTLTVVTSPAVTSGFQWQVNTGSGWVNLTNTAPYSGVTTNVLTINPITAGLNGYQYRASVPSSCGASSTTYTNAATLTVISTTGTPTANISVSPSNSGCVNSTFTFTANITNGSPTPVYQWKVNGTNVGTNSNSFTTSTLNTGDVVTMVLSTTYPCTNPPSATSNAITMTLTNPVTPDVTVAANPPATSICSGLPITFTATPVNGGATPTYQWQINGVNVGTNSPTFTSSTLSNNDAVRVVLTSSIGCVTKQKDTSSNINYFVTPSVTPDVVISSNTPNNTACKNAVVHFSAIINNPGMNPVLQWKLNGTPVGANNLDYYVSTLNSGDVVSCELTSDAMCRTKNRDTSNSISMTITNGPNPTVVKTGNTLSTAVPYSTYQWIFNGANIAGATNPTYVVNMPGNYWVHVSDNNGCEGEANPLWVPYVLGITGAAKGEDIKLYPNPAQQQLYISSKTTFDVKIYSALGQLVLSQSKAVVVDISALNDGVYLVELINNNGEIVMRDKLIKDSK